jgi:hypothetical protein
MQLPPDTLIFWHNAFADCALSKPMAAKRTNVFPLTTTVELAELNPLNTVCLWLSLSQAAFALAAELYAPNCTHAYRLHSRLYLFLVQHPPMPT